MSGVHASDKDYAVLRRFGAMADRLEQPFIGQGGFLLLGEDSFATPPGIPEEVNSNGREGKEAGSEAGTRSRSRPEAQAASGTPSHAVDGGVAQVLSLAELYRFHPGTTERYSS